MICKYFPTNTCEYDSECRFNHEILTHGQQICYKCGKKFDRKSSLLNHIKNNHDDPCLKHILGKCTYGSRCVFKHTTAQVTSENKEVVHRSAHVESHEDFPPIPATINRLAGTEKKQMIGSMNLMVQQMNQMMTQMTSLMISQQ